MKTIIAGSRTIEDYDALQRVMARIDFTIDEVVSGGCWGVDLMGERWARENGIPVRQFAADWAKHGRTAGELRNREMAQYADALVILWDGKSPGASCMMREASKAGIEIVNTIYGMDPSDLDANEREILNYYWAGKGRLAFRDGHWAWDCPGESVREDAPKVDPRAVDSLIARGLMQAEALTVLVPGPVKP